MGDVYKLAEKLSDLIWYAFDEWSKKVQKSIGYQIICSADSIASNIAEGYGRYTPADRRNFYRYARGSFHAKGVPMGDELGPKLNAFITSTK
ncbi:MAG: four helix bundle protein [Candidatus Marinimicrobia bacterium]|nr:four helix bundle protein [Candidatus Neomarinimicrobiota bacterium]